MLNHFFPSDSTAAEMNRHHYSLYVHNCRLVFLLRRDFTQVDTFRPAEFHWKLEQVRSGVCVSVCVRVWFLCLCVCVCVRTVSYMSASMNSQ